MPGLPAFVLSGAAVCSMDTLRRELRSKRCIMRRPILIVVALLTLAGIAAADEGMWLFNLPPTQQLKSKYGFDLTKSWLQHTQLSSVRFNVGGSGSFVSPDGLTFTNH